jgi:hypothetical protein
MNKYPSLSAYSFVANSPIVHIDPNGKEIIITRIPNGGTDGKDLVLICVTAKWVDMTSRKQELEVMRNEIASVNPNRKSKIKRMSERLEKEEIKYGEFVRTEIDNFKKNLEESFSGQTDDLEWKMEVEINEASNNSEIGKKDHVFYAVDQVFEAQARVNQIGGLALYYAPNSSSAKAAANEYVHEPGHLFGLLHIDGVNGYFSKAELKTFNTVQGMLNANSHRFDRNNTMWSSSLGQGGSKIEQFQILFMEDFYNTGDLNLGSNSYDNSHGHSDEKPDVSRYSNCLDSP